MIFRKKKPEIIEQIVFDITYQNICPICKIMVTEEKHFYEKDILEKNIIMECPKCHIAVWGQRTKVVKTLKKYESVPSGKGDMGLDIKLISEEIIN